MSDQLSVGEDGQVYRAHENLDEFGNRVEDDWGYFELVTPEELLKAARRFLNDDLILGALDIQAVNV